MPKIEEFNPGNLALRPSELGVDATAAAARRIGGAYNQAAAAKEQTGHLLGSGIASAGEAAVAIEDHREISTGAAKGVELFAGLVDSKDQAIKGIDPNDPAYGQKVDAAVKQWREQQLEPALDQFSQGFNTQKSQAWAEHFVDQTRTHMWRESTADVASAAALGVKNTVRTAVNEATNTALQNPSSVDALLDLTEHSVGGIADSSPIKGVAAAQMKTGLVEQAKEQIVKAGAIGAIQKSSDPEATAADWVKRYPKYINGAEAIQLGNNAREQIRARDADDHRKDVRAKQEAKDVSEEVADAYRTNIDSADPKIKDDATAVQVLNDPRLQPKDRANIIGYIKRQTKPETEVRISRQTTVDLLREMRDPDVDADKLMQRAWDARLMDPGKKGSMTESDFNSFRREMIDRKTPDGMALSQDRGEFFKKYASSIDVGMTLGTHSALGSQRMYQAEQDAIRQEKVLKSQGKDPHQLYNSASPDFIGKPEALKKYQPTMQEIQKYDNDIRDGKMPGAAAKPVNGPAASPMKLISTPPAVGDIYKGYRFKGGDAHDSGNWEKVK